MYNQTKFQILYAIECVKYVITGVHFYMFYKKDFARSIHFKNSEKASNGINLMIIH